MKNDRPTKKIVITYHLTDCKGCPKVGTKLTKGYGYSTDYFCTITRKTTSGYVEWDRDLNPVPDDCPLKVVPVSTNIELENKIHALKKEVTELNEVLRKKNLALDALGWVWCSGGCSGGVHRFYNGDECPLTGEQVNIVERNTIRLRDWYEARSCMNARKNDNKMSKCDTCGANCFK